MESFVFLKILRPPAGSIRQIRELSVATVFEVCRETRLMDQGIKSLVRNQKICGPVVTCRLETGDNLTLHKAITLAEKGDVLVVDASGALDVAVWGSLMSCAAQSRDIAGIIVDGAVRDTREIGSMGFPVWARGINPKGPTKMKFGSINCPVMAGGVWVQPGDIILADDDGVGVIPACEISMIVELGIERKNKEAELLRRLTAGETTLDLLGLSTQLDNLHVVEVDHDYHSWLMNKGNK